MTIEPLNPRLHRLRQKRERRFVWAGRAALVTSLALLVLLLGILFVRGLGGFMTVEVRVPVTFTTAAAQFEEGDTWEDLSPSRYAQLARAGLMYYFLEEQADPPQQMAIGSVLSQGAGVVIKHKMEANQAWQDTTQNLWLNVSADVEYAYKNNRETLEGLSEVQQDVVRILEQGGNLRMRFNTAFFTEADSRNPERAGFLGSIIGSLFTMAITLLIAFPIGVMTAVYLQEFAKPGRWVDIIEININNLAAVPSIVYGLLGLAVYLNLMGLPRSAPLVGGMTLALMVLPVIIIATRSALRAVPDSIRQAALALGATPLQTVWHHTLPLALPGVMTGTILGVARALGETAPLLMIGMVAFVADIPHGFTDSATAMPVQVFLWAASPEAGFREKTAAGILVLLVILLALNALAIYIRKKSEVKW